MFYDTLSCWLYNYYYHYYYYYYYYYITTIAVIIIIIIIFWGFLFNIQIFSIQIFRHLIFFQSDAISQDNLSKLLTVKQSAIKNQRQGNNKILHLLLQISCYYNHLVNINGVQFHIYVYIIYIYIYIYILSKIM